MAEAKATLNLPLLLGGIGGIGLGVLLLLYGLAPAAPILGVFSQALSGGFSAAGAEGMSTTMDRAISGLGARVVWDILACVLILTGSIVAKRGVRKPKPKTMQELVEEEFARRLGGAQPGQNVSTDPAAAAPSAAGAPAPAHPSANAAAVAVPTRYATSSDPSRANDVRCPRCGRLLLGGRFCRVCDRA